MQFPVNDMARQRASEHIWKEPNVLKLTNV
jgi:hypothetical protein